MDKVFYFNVIMIEGNEDGFEFGSELIHHLEFITEGDAINDLNKMSQPISEFIETAKLGDVFRSLLITAICVNKEIGNEL